MQLARRKFLHFSLTALAGMFSRRVEAQRSGMGGRVATPQNRAAASGRPFDAHFTDVAAMAGLTASVIYGGVDHDDYIIEADGCGCAFVDYDNDGWIDIFLLSGTRLGGAPRGSSNRLYKNNRDGSFT